MAKTLKRIALALGVLIALLGVAFAAAAMKAGAMLERKFETHRVKLAPPADGDSAAIERGEHLVRSRYGCAACHGENLAGGVMIDEAPIGRLLGPNLTRGRGSRVFGYDMAEWDRSVRHGVKKDGRPSLMPSEDFFKMSDAELSDIVAYINSLPPVDAEVASATLGPVGKLLLVTGKLPIAAERQLPEQAHPHEPPPATDSVRFGEHLVATCLGCHRSDFAGGPIAFGPPDWPAAANLTQHEQGLGAWSFEDFDRALTQGISKDGSPLKVPMLEVIAVTKNMLPAERSAIWDYLRSVPAVAKGS